MKGTAMKTLALALLILPGLAGALEVPVVITSITVTATTTVLSDTASTTAAVAAFSTGTESAPTTTNEGIHLSGIKSLSVSVEASGTMTNGGKLNAYGYNGYSGLWTRLPDLDLTVQALARQSFAASTIPVGVMRLTFVPTGIGTVSGTLYIVGRR